MIASLGRWQSSYKIYKLAWHSTGYQGFHLYLVSTCWDFLRGWALCVSKLIQLLPPNLAMTLTDPNSTRLCTGKSKHLTDRPCSCACEPGYVSQSKNPKQTLPKYIIYIYNYNTLPYNIETIDCIIRKKNQVRCPQENNPHSSPGGCWFRKLWVDVQTSPGIDKPCQWHFRVTFFLGKGSFQGWGIRSKL